MELIISMAVMVIVVGAITLLMQTGTRSYSFAKSELDLQMESQTLLAQMNTMILEANSAHYDSENHILTLYQMESRSLPATSGSIGAGDSKFVESKTVKNMKFIQFDEAENKLYLYEHDHDQIKPASGGSIECSPNCDLYSADALFAEYIEKFDVSIEENKVTIHLGMKNGKVKYEVDATTKIRNKLVTYP